MKVIINADDFGYTKAVTDGIIKAYHLGIVRSTTVLCNMEYVRYGKELIKECPNLALGVHLTLTLGKSLTKNKTLTDKDGCFYKPAQLKNHQFDVNEVYYEFKAQIEKFIEIFGFMPSHLDSHHGMHDFQNNLEATQRLAKEYHLPVRRYNHFLFVNEFIQDCVSVDGLIEILEKYNHQDIEIMSHCGECDLELYQKSSYALERVKELAVLCHPRVIEYIQKHHIIITNYFDEEV